MSVEEIMLEAYNEGVRDGMKGRESASIVVLMFEGYAASSAYDEGLQCGAYVRETMSQDEVNDV